jgi:hypothetical protein
MFDEYCQDLKIIGYDRCKMSLQGVWMYSSVIKGCIFLRYSKLDDHCYYC